MDQDYLSNLVSVCLSFCLSVCHKIWSAISSEITVDLANKLVEILWGGGGVGGVKVTSPDQNWEKWQH